MHPFIKITSALIIAAFCAGIYACVQDGNSQNGSLSTTDPVKLAENLPKLLDRAENLRYGKEWDAVQSHYAKQRGELMKDPSALEPWLNLAEVFIQEARVTGEHPHYYPAALKVLDELLSKKFDEKDPKQQDARFRATGAKASVLLSQHEFAEALKLGEEAKKMNPYNAGIYGVLVDANVELGNYPAAVKAADDMTAIRPDLRSYSRVSYLREIHGDVDGAIKAMDMAAAAGYPGADQTAWTRLTLGDLYRHYGKPKEAEMQYTIILQERPDYPFALAALGELELEKKNYPKAEELLKKAAGIIPEVGFYESLAEVQRATGRQAEFEKTVDEILSMMQEDVASGHNMDLEFAHVYSELKGDQKKALEYAMKEYSARPENIDVNGKLALIYSKMGDQAKAKEHLEKALRTGSKNPEWLAVKV